MIAALLHGAVELFWLAMIVSTIVAVTILLVAVFDRLGLTIPDDYSDDYSGFDPDAELRRLVSER